MTPNEEYQRAKVLIDDARQSQATKLDLSGLGLAKWDRKIVCVRGQNQI